MRNPEFEFIPTDSETLVSWLAAQYEKTVGTAVRPGSKERLFIDWVASILIHERSLANDAANQNIPSRARGENLDALAKLFYAGKRPEPTCAACRMRFEISQALDFDVIIPKGTRVTDAGAALYWETEAELRVRAGETAVEGGAVCQTAGTAGNGYLPGQLGALVDLFPYYAACANVTETGGGSDAPDDAAFYELLRLSMDAYSCAGARGGYIYFAKQVSSEIADVVANSPEPGRVSIYCLMKNGEIAGEEVKRKVLAACSADEVRPMTDFVSVEDPEIVEYNVCLTWYAPNGEARSTVKLQEDVAAVVQEYTAWQRGKLGRDINPSRLIGLLMQSGIKRVELAEPAFTALRDGADGKVPQVARCAGVTLTNGGFEDE